VVKRDSELGFLKLVGVSSFGVGESCIVCLSFAAKVAPFVD